MAHQKLTAEPTAFVLDTNVLIDMERFYFGHSSMRLALANETVRVPREDLHRLLGAFAVRPAGSSVDLRYGFAAYEIGVRRDGSVNTSAYRNAVHAAQKIVEWTERQIDRAFANRHAPISRDGTYLRSRPRPAMTAHADIMTMIGPSYGALLKISALCRPRKRGSALPARRRFEEYIEWMVDTLGICLPYETRVAAAMMAGSPEAQRGARKLLKFGGSTEADELATKAWNAAWDLWFLRLPEGHTFGMLKPERGNNEVTALVTRNDDPMWLREAGSIRALIGTGSEQHILTELQLDVRADAVGDEVVRVLDEKLGGMPSPERLLRDPGEVSKAARCAVAVAVQGVVG